VRVACIAKSIVSNGIFFRRSVGKHKRIEPTAKLETDDILFSAAISANEILSILNQRVDDSD
jgi:hypothetical protein